MANSLTDKQVRSLISTARDLARVDTLASLMQDETFPEDALRPTALHIHDYTKQLRKTLDKLTSVMDLSVDIESSVAEEDDGIDTDTVNSVLSNYGDHHEVADFVVSNSDKDFVSGDDEVDLEHPDEDVEIPEDETLFDESEEDLNDADLVKEFGGHDEYDEVSQHIESAVETPNEGPEEDLSGYSKPGDINERVLGDVAAITDGTVTDDYDERILRSVTDSDASSSSTVDESSDAPDFENDEDDIHADEIDDNPDASQNVSGDIDEYNDDLNESESSLVEPDDEVLFDDKD